MKNREGVKTNGRAIFYSVLWESFRNAALDLGWTLALHGSMASDMDIVAIKWTENAKDEKELIKSLSNCIGETVWKDNHFKEPTSKPHGRWCYTLSIYSDYYVDLSIIRN